ncbi:transglycosylase SLT domain-containing protein, partial [Flavobacteriaceae bacterium]|nr:transglycosylase SLT domain-containing protein [Flavobacteriaceae bacterium]
MMKGFLVLVVLTFGQLQSQTMDSLAVVNAPTLDSIPANLNVQGIEKKWRTELYKNSLYDTLSKAVSNQSYEAIYYPELPSDTLKKRLAILDAKTPFNIEYNPSLESVIKSYLKNRKRSTETLISRSHYYFPMFEAVLDKYNLPLEIKYLAVVESALKPCAKSRVGATGLWQFMFATGKQYGLEVSSYVDERCDPLRATNAAAKYLDSLYKIFGDWDLALAAYNSGPGNVTKAIRRSGGYQNYWNIRSFLPSETAGYLPAFLATMYLFEYADAHGFKVDKNQFPIISTDTIHVKQMISLDHVAELTDTKIETLQFLNPAYKLDIIPVLKDKTYTLRLPLTKIGDFVQNEQDIYAFSKAEYEAREKPLPQFFEIDSKIRYKVKSGDFLGKIARNF